MECAQNHDDDTDRPYSESIFHVQVSPVHNGEEVGIELHLGVKQPPETAYTAAVAQFSPYKKTMMAEAFAARVIMPHSMTM